jgi:hypothetical protein
MTRYARDARSRTRTLRVDDHMTQLRAHAVETLDQTSCTDHTSANPCADGEIDEILVTFACPELPFGESGHVCIVIQIGGDAKMRGQFGCEGEILPLRDIWRGKDGACMRVERAGGGDANGSYAVLGPYGFNGFFQAIIDAWLSGKGAGALMGNGCNAVWFIDSNADMSTADVDCYSVAHEDNYTRAN